MPNSANYNNAVVWNGLTGNVTSVGTNGGPSAYGTYDQTGNVSQWYDLYQPLDMGHVGYRGGSWSDSSDSLSSSHHNNSAPPFGYAVTIGFRIASSLNLLGLPNFVTVGNVGNSNDTTGYGAVAYSYKIGALLVTNTEYAEFLNAVAKTDSHELYHANMGASRGGITRSGSSGVYAYVVKNNYGNKPVNYVSWFDCARYCNWLHNEKGNGSTETGAYTLVELTGRNAVTKNSGALYYIPNENEWYKAAYYKGGSTNAGYWTYATQSNVAPTAVQATPDGDGIAIRNFKIGTQNNVSYIRTDDSAEEEFSYDPNKLVLVYDTSKEPANNTVSVPINNVTGSPNVTIYWGDGTTSTQTTNGFATKTYATSGVYVVQVSGTMTRLSYGSGLSSTNNRLKLLRCLSFGNVGITQLDSAFQNCSNLIQCPDSLPTTSSVSSLSSCFASCTLFNDARITGWNTANVRDMNFMFNNAIRFNQPIGSWNTAAVTGMSAMFSIATDFNQNISSWNTSSVTNMSGMFRSATSFNQNIGSWNTSNVANMNSMFRDATSFNQDISNWDIRKVVLMAIMFTSNNWGTSNYNAALVAWAALPDSDLKSQAITAFAASGGNTRVTSNNHDMNVGSRVNISGTTNYNGDYNVVAVVGNAFDIGVTFVTNDATGTMKHRRSLNVQAGFGTNKYNSGIPATARDILTTTYNWTITDGGQV